MSRRAKRTIREGAKGGKELERETATYVRRDGATKRVLTDWRGETYACPPASMGFPLSPGGLVTCCDIYAMTIMLIFGFCEARATPQAHPMRMK